MRRKVLDPIDEWYRSGRKTALMVRGARQVGKTHSVIDFCTVNCIHALKIDLAADERSRAVFEGDLTADALILKLSAVHTDFVFEPGKTLIFLDEIQECPDARTALKSFAEDGRYRVIAASSFPGLNMDKVRLPPTGYVEYIDMAPMDFEEFLWALGVPEAGIQEVRRSLSECKPIDDVLFSTIGEHHRWYLLVGGMPKAVRSFTECRQYGPVRRIQERIAEGQREDIRKYTGNGSLRTIALACYDAVPKMLVSGKGRFMFSEVEGRASGKGYYDGYSHYLPASGWLSTAYMVIACRRLSEIRMPLEAQVCESMFRLYMPDTGLLTSLCRSELATEVAEGRFGAGSGFIAENAVAQAFAAQGRKLFFYRDPNGRTRADFATYLDGNVCAIAVRTGRNRTSPSIEKLRSSGIPGMIFETRNCFIDDKGIRHYPLFAASFMDSIDRFRMPEPDFSGIDRLKAEYGGRRSALLRRARLRKGVFIVHLTTHSR